MGNQKYMAYIGTYSQKSQGIYVCELDADMGTLKHVYTYSQLVNPSYLTISRDRTHLYAVSETDDFDGKPGGAAGSYSINGQTGELQFLNCQPTGEKVPCHLCTDNLDNYLFTANYSDGSITMLPLDSDGKIRPAVCTIKHHGSGPNAERQGSPHAHFVTMTPDDKYLCAIDLGIDKLLSYDIGKHKDRILPAQIPEFMQMPGLGPRHMVFGSDGRFAYVANELLSSVTVLEYSPLQGFSYVQRISTLSAGYTGNSYCAAIQISHDGRFLYVSNRGHDSIAIFNIEKNSGWINLVSITQTNGKFPRDFAIDPTGRFLFCANQYSDTITAFSINSSSGLLESTRNVLYIPSPACIKFLVLG